MNATHTHTFELVQSVEQFLYLEAQLLDDRKFEDWLDLLTPDAYYWAPARLEQKDPWSEVSLIFDDREIMSNRITRLRHPRVYAQLPPSRAVRQVSNIKIGEYRQNEPLTVSSTFFMLEHRPTLPRPMERTFAGHYVHTLVTDNDEFKIASKKVVLANCDAPLDSLFVYF